MRTAIEELKTRAHLLQRALQTNDAAARARLRALAELRRADDDELVKRAPDIQRKHCLAVIARESGFSGWEHARTVIDGEGEAEIADFGKLLYTGNRGGFLHPWFATHAEAKAAHAPAGDGEARFLLVYGRHHFLAGAGFIEGLGLDPVDPDFAAIGYDWARPTTRAARSRLYAKLLAARRPA